MEAHQRPVLQGLIGTTRVGVLEGLRPSRCYQLLWIWSSSVPLAALWGSGFTLCPCLPKFAVRPCETFFVTVAVTLGRR